MTWQELDWSHAAVVPPSRWTEFALHHTWRDSGRVERLFALAADVALRPVNPHVRVADIVGF